MSVCLFSKTTLRIIGLTVHAKFWSVWAKCAAEKRAVIKTVINSDTIYKIIKNILKYTTKLITF